MNNPKVTIWSKSFILLCLSVLFMAISFYFLIPTLPLYISEVLKADKSTVGIVIAMFTISALIIRPFAGFFLDRIGRKIIFIISFIFMTIFFNLYLVAYSVIIMAIFRFIHGLAWGVTSTAGATIAVDILPPQKRGEGLGIYGLSMPIAMAVGPLLGFYILHVSNFNILFISGFTLSLIGLILSLYIKYPIYQKPSSPKGLNFNSLIEKKSLPIAFNVLFTSLPYGGLVSFIAIYAPEAGVHNAGLFFLIFAVGIGISRIFAGKIFDKIGPKFLFLFGITLLIIGLPILALFKNPYGFFISGALLGIGNGIIFPVSQAMINNMVDICRRGVANSTLFIAFDLGIGSGMIMTGFLADKISLSSTFLLSSVICLLGFIYALFFVFKHYERNKINL